MFPTCMVRKYLNLISAALDYQKNGNYVQNDLFKYFQAAQHSRYFVVLTAEHQKFKSYPDGTVMAV